MDIAGNEEKAQAAEEGFTSENIQERMAQKLDKLVTSHDIFTRRFHVAKSRYHLTEEEKDARKQWNQKRDKFVLDHQDDLFANATVFKYRTQEAIVSSSILPAEYSTGDTTSLRSKYDEQRSKRYYPQTIEEWTDFPKSFHEKFETAQLPLCDPAPLFRSMTDRTTLTDESTEQSFINYHVFGPFSEAGLMCLPFQVESEQRQVIIGKPDATCYLKGDSSIVAQKTGVFEAKTLHNMLLPNDFETLKLDYEQAVKIQLKNRDKARSENWSQICHPLAQEFAYMVDNGVRYGALFCASKAYFIFFEGSGRTIDRVRITGAYIAGQKNFLRAWACMLRFANGSPAPPGSVAENHCLELPKGQDNAWLENTPIDEDKKAAAAGVEVQDQNVRGPDDDGSSSDGGGSRHRPVGENHKGNSKRSGGFPPSKKPRIEIQTTPSRDSKKGGAQAALISSPPELVQSWSAESKEPCSPSMPLTPPDPPFFEPFCFEKDFVGPVNFQDLVIGHLLGVGSNGDVFESNFHEEVVAVKQFDLSKNFDGYKNEVKAYMHLKKAWGKLVPAPKFIAQSPSGMVRFLGLQKGRAASDKVFEEQFGKVISELNKEYHFQPLDASEGRNCVIVDGDNGQDKLVIMDLECWELIGESK